jgi:hypothetical protein
MAAAKYDPGNLFLISLKTGVAQTKSPIFPVWISKILGFLDGVNLFRKILI